MRIGILTLPFEPNYGWALQLYALQQFLIRLGHEPVCLDRRWNRGRSNSGLWVSIKRWGYYHLLCRRFYSFSQKNIIRTIECYSSDDLEKLVSQYQLNAVIIGSDQVWRIENVRNADLNYWGDFLSELPIKKLTYAVSFGTNQWKGTDEETLKIQGYLNSFSGLSVREKDAVEMCSTLFGVKAEHVLDPTLLLKAEEYENLLSHPIEKAAMLTTYILDPSEQKDALIHSISKDRSLEVNHLYKRHTGSCHFYGSVESWLQSIRDANCVVVDSFHGMVFAILYHKQFVVLGNEKRGMSRFSSLLSSLGLLDRLLTNYDEKSAVDVMNKPIDYDSVEEKLEVFRKTSLHFLTENLCDAE
ncbi:MAG: polysaccharide pyruvyl transferase family protein [Paludibacteraceae bacterium]|nr:polysaccharide pyruvyl transferase family protein [Paludibacteraceae bacterium]